MAEAAGASHIKSVVGLKNLMGVETPNALSTILQVLSSIIFTFNGNLRAKMLAAHHATTEPSAVI